MPLATTRKTHVRSTGWAWYVRTLDQLPTIDVSLEQTPNPYMYYMLFPTRQSAQCPYPNNATCYINSAKRFVSLAGLGHPPVGLILLSSVGYNVLAKTPDTRNVQEKDVNAILKTRVGGKRGQEKP